MSVVCRSRTRRPNWIKCILFNSWTVWPEIEEDGNSLQDKKWTPTGAGPMVPEEEEEEEENSFYRQIVAGKLVPKRPIWCRWVGPELYQSSALDGMGACEEEPASSSPLAAAAAAWRPSERSACRVDDFTQPRQVSDDNYWLCTRIARTWLTAATSSQTCTFFIHQQQKTRNPKCLNWPAIDRSWEFLWDAGNVRHENERQKKRHHQR